MVSKLFTIYALHSVLLDTSLGFDQSSVTREPQLGDFKLLNLTMLAVCGRASGRAFHEAEGVVSKSGRGLYVIELHPSQDE